MNRSTTVALSIAVAFAISFSVLFLVLLQYSYKFQDGILLPKDNWQYHLQKEFYSQHFDPNDKKIFLVGASPLIPLNTTYIHDHLLSIGKNFTIYNLAIGSDKPIDRLKTIDWMISAKPMMVVYGISDFQFQAAIPPTTISGFVKPFSFLPDPESFFHEFFWSIQKNSYLSDNPSDFNLNFLDTPKYVTLKFLLEATQLKSTDQTKNIVTSSSPTYYYPFPHMYFNTIAPGEYTISNDTYLRNSETVVTYPGFDPTNENPNVIALKEIIQKLRQNNIKVVLFVTPHQKYYFDSMPNTYRKSFEDIVNNISQESHITIYSLWEKYADLYIWWNVTHTAISKNATIYDDDIIKMILNEVNK